METTELHSVLESSEVVSLRPGDVVIFRAPGNLTSDSRAHLIAMLEEVFPDHESIILEGGQELAVVRPEPGLLRRLFGGSGG